MVLAARKLETLLLSLTYMITIYSTCIIVGILCVPVEIIQQFFINKILLESLGV